MAAPITWRNVAAPDATGAAQILQMANQNIGKAITGVQDIAQNQVQEITDKNVSQVAQSILNSGEGLEGLTALKGLEGEIAGLNSADVGGTKGLQMITGVLGDRKAQLEKQATDSFNDLIATAQQTGQWDEVKQNQDVFASLVSNSAPTLEKARSAQAIETATRDLAALRTGAVKPADLLSQTGPILSQPEYAAVLDAAANQVRTEKLGSVVRNIPQYLNSVQRQGQNPSQVLSNMYKGFSDKEIAENYEVFSGVTKQVQDAYINSLNLTAAEKLAVDAQKQVIDNAKTIFEQENQVIKNKVARSVGGDVQAVNAYEQYKDSGLSMSEVIRQRLGEDADLDTIDNALTTLVSNQNLKLGEISPAAMAYAFSMHPEVGDWLTDDPKAFAELVKAAQSQIDNVANAYGKLDELLLARQKDFLSYEQNAGAQLMNMSNELVNSRRNARQPRNLQIQPFNGYTDADFQRQVDSLLGSSRAKTTNKVSTQPTRAQEDARALINAGTSTPVSVNTYAPAGRSLFSNVN